MYDITAFPDMGRTKKKQGGGMPRTGGGQAEDELSESNGCL